MEKERFIELSKKLIENASSELLKECERLYDSGGIDTTNYNSTYSLLRTVFYVALLNITKSNKPIDKSDIKAANNLRKF